VRQGHPAIRACSPTRGFDWVYAGITLKGDIDMFRKAALTAMLIIAFAQALSQPSTNDERGVRDFIAHWNVAYTGLDAGALAALETNDYEMIDRFGHWIKSEGPEFNQRLWATTFKDIYHGKPGPARTVESIRFMAPNIAVVQARANHADGVVLDDGTRIPPFWEIDTYTLIKADAGWRVILLNIHNQIDPSMERPGEHVPNASPSQEKRN
jgi:ketosteroid isomerase-like protein